MRLLGSGVALILAGGVVALADRQGRRPAETWFRLLVAAGCVLIAVPALATLLGRAPDSATWHPALPGGPWEFGLDPLSAWFLLLVAALGAGTASFGASYLAAEHGEPGSRGRAHLGFAVLLAAMVGVLAARSAVAFLIAWELMAVSAYLLIMHEGERAEVARAGLLYLGLTHAGTLALIAMFLAWRAPGGDLTFASLAAAGGSLPLGGAAILLLALFGFGVKAGMVPLHFWLPGAHAAAPSHVSALLSGVMIKTGIYGLLRVLALLGGAPAWWGWTLLGLGLASGVLGVLWALAQHDLKRVLAYSSVENIGIILLGMGVGALGTAYHQPAVAVLGFTGAVLHTLNHALFKGLLFLGAGAVVRATGTRALEELGGLGRRMPLTAAAFLVGSAAIVGLPPLNGFVSEWVVLQALLRGGAAPGAAKLVVFAAPGLALIAALAVACFSRVFGVVFLGHPRAARPGPASDVGPGMVVPMLALGSACTVLGFAPLVALAPAARVVAQVLSLPPEGPVAASAGVLPAGLGLGGFTAALAGAAALVAAARLGLARGGATARASTWGCGYPRPEARMQYTASSFGAPILSAFGSPVRPRARRTAASFATDPRDRVLARIGPAWSRIRAAAAALRSLQQGRITTYLQYIVLTLLLLLLALFLSVARRG